MWLHNAAAPGSIAGARATLASCPAVKRSGAISSQWDVARVNDAVWTVRIASIFGLGDGCRG